VKSIQSLNSDTFQDFCSSLLIELFGIKVFPGGKGKDGGRDGIYSGKINIPNTEDEFIGDWVIQVKYHDKDDTTQPTWLKRPVVDLKSEVKKFKGVNHNFDSYLFLTNVPLTWVKDKGSFDQIYKGLRQEFEDAGFINFIVFDKNMIQALFPFITKSIQFFLSDGDKLEINGTNPCNKITQANKLVDMICSNIAKSVFSYNSNHNPHFKSELSWIQGGMKFYSFEIRNHSDIQYILDCYKVIFHNEIIVVYGKTDLIGILNGKIAFLPIPHLDDSQEIIFNYQKYLRTV